MSVRRYDRGEVRLDKNRTPQGFLRAEATIARTGVQLYRRPDGSTRREYRPPDEVFDAAALASFDSAPITLGHPPEPVTSKNVEKYGRGIVSVPKKHEDGRRVAASFLITHADAIEAAESGKAGQTSGGYECDLDETPGTSPEGEKYDAIQRVIRGNHVALVDRGRAGPDVCVKMDALDAELVEEDGQPNPEDSTMKTTIRGMAFDIAEQAAQALELERAEAAAALKAAQDAAISAKAEAEKQKARGDVAEGARDAAEKARRDAEDPKRVDAAVSLRAELVSRVRAVLGADHKVEGKDALALKREVAAKLAPDLKLDGKSDDYVASLFDYTFAEFEKKNPAALALAGVIRPPVPGKADEEDLDPRTKMMRDQQETSRKMGQK